MMAKNQIVVNGNALDFIQEETLTDLLRRINIPHRQGVAIAINNKVVTKSLWEKTIIYNNDTILIINASQGG